jgi:hypothetical protein
MPENSTIRRTSWNYLSRYCFPPAFVDKVNVLPYSFMKCGRFWRPLEHQLSAPYYQNEGPAAFNRCFINSCSFSTVASYLCRSLTCQVVAGIIEVRLGICISMSRLTEVLGSNLETRTISTRLLASRLEHILNTLGALSLYIVLKYYSQLQQSTPQFQRLSENHL